MRLPRAAFAAATALLLLIPVEAAALGRDGDRWRNEPGALPTVYRLDPNGEADVNIFPEGVAASGTTYYVGSTTDGTVYRGDIREETATPFLLAGEDGRTSAVGMKLAGQTLFIAGGATGRVWAYDVGTGDLVGSWTVADPGEANPTFLNDLIVTPGGDVYVTDSRRPVLYRIAADGRTTTGVAPLEEFLTYAGTPIVYGEGFNVGGIAVTPDGTTLILAQSNTRSLFRVTLADKSVVKIDLGGQEVGADGLVLRGRRDLSAVERQGDVGYVVEIRLDRELDAGRVDSRTPDATFDDPTTAARVDGSLLVVNSQFGARNAGVPPTPPFTVSRVGIR